MRVTMYEGRATIHGIYDINQHSCNKAKQMFAMHFPNTNVVVYDSLEAACNDPEADAILICTPNYTHIEVLRTVIKSGKHILMEKPMATTLQDAYEITQLTKGYKKVFQVGLQYRYKPTYAEAIHEALVRKTLGNIKMINIAEHRIPFLDKVNQWNKFSKFSGGTLVEKCCHYFDLMNLFSQSRPRRVFATGSMAVNFKDFEHNNEKSDILDNAFVSVEYENGIRASFTLCMFAPMFYEELVLCGDEGRLKAHENEDFLPASHPKCHLEIMCGESNPSRICTPTYPAPIDASGHSGATYFEHIYFVNNMEGKKTNTATVEEGFWSVVVGTAAEESVKTGKIIEIEQFLKDNKISVK
jgi:predicted dehydrogenase